MGKSWEPPLCIDCKHYTRDPHAITPDPEHLCCRKLKWERSLVTGEQVRTGHYFDCQTQRDGKSDAQCGMSARFFKEKK